ncbi:MAG: hypothetical protein ACJAV1_001058 [Paraglaciecola sp.]|jgi:hypothetical protein
MPWPPIIRGDPSDLNPTLFLLDSNNIQLNDNLMTTTPCKSSRINIKTTVRMTINNINVYKTIIFISSLKS